MNAPERRRDARIKIAFEVVNSVPPLEGIAYLSDLSATGASVEGTSARPALGQAVQLTAHWSDRQPPLVLSGRVLRIEESGFALAFEKPNPQLERLLAQEGLVSPDTGEGKPRPASGNAAGRLGVAQHTPAGSSRPAAKRVGVSPYREVAVDCCANTQWISGRICTLPTRPLIDHLNLGDPFLRIVDALTPHQAEPMAFLALRSEAVDLIFPLEGQEAIETEQRMGRIVERPIRCLLPYAVIDGNLAVIDRIRVSDHLMRCDPFISLRECRVRLAQGQRAPRDISRVQVALVNVRRVLAISDLGVSPTPPD